MIAGQCDGRFAVSKKWGSRARLSVSRETKDEHNGACARNRISELIQLGPWRQTPISSRITSRSGAPKQLIQDSGVFRMLLLFRWQDSRCRRRRSLFAILTFTASAAVLAHRRPSAILAPAASAAMLAYRPSSALLAPAAYAAVLAYRRPSALLALAASAAVLAYRRPSALLALAALAAVLAYRRPSALLAPAASAAVFAYRHQATYYLDLHVVLGQV